MSALHRTDALKAVLFDLDGTLYHQAPVRALMAAELAVDAVRHGLIAGRRTTKALLTFRRVCEETRELGIVFEPLHDLQVAETARRTGASIERVRDIVDEWMFRRPLKYLHMARRRDVLQRAVDLRRSGFQVGVLSDYPVTDKLAALRVDSLFSLQLCTTDRSINALKPHPRGFLIACEQWGLRPAQVAYVGDRRDVDLAGAISAGMTCFLVGDRTSDQQRKVGSHASGSLEELDDLCRATAA